MSGWRWVGDDLLLDLHVQPGAASSALAGMHGTALKVRIAAPPRDGRANRALTKLLATAFGVPKSRVQVERGAGGRSKRVRITAPTRWPDELPEGDAVAPSRGAD